ncbi:MAG: hypothetical protein LBB79_05890 [Prevotellaceae bacterium]|nr:hypothetical protein [Prevotellaceae bacterium]
MKKKYQGVVVPMVTPFTATGRVDEAAVVRICQNFAAHGVSPLALGIRANRLPFLRKKAAG